MSDSCLKIVNSGLETKGILKSSKERPCCHNETTDPSTVPLWKYTIFGPANPSVLPMFTILLRHSWQMLRRSPFFEKNLFTRGFLAFMVFFMVMQLFAMGRMLPGILNEAWPDRAPAVWVFGSLPLFLLADLFMRFFLQKTPRRHVLPYLHLPVSRPTLSAWWIVNAWLHPMNAYLLFFFWPFIQMTINPATSSQHLGLLGIFLLTSFNQSIIMLLGTPGRMSKVVALVLTALLALTGLSYLFYADRMMDYSMQLFLAMVYAKPMAFVIPLAVLAALHGLAMIGSVKNYHLLYEISGREEQRTGNNAWERWLATVPRYGDLWLLEWRLLIRNRRSRSGVYIILPMALAYALFAAFTFTDPAQLGQMIIYIMVAGSLGGLQLQHAFSWDSHFFDFLASRNISMERYVRAKFYFYTFIAMIQMVVVSLATGFINLPVMLMCAAITLYVCGAGYYVYLRMGVRHSSRFDPEGRSSFNMEGISGMKFISGFLMIISIVPLFFIGFFITQPHGAALVVGAAGLAFLLTHRRWTKTIAQRLKQRKHINLALYRQK